MYFEEPDFKNDNPEEELLLRIERATKLESDNSLRNMELIEKQKQKMRKPPLELFFTSLVKTHSTRSHFGETTQTHVIKK